MTRCPHQPFFGRAAPRTLALVAVLTLLSSIAEAQTRSVVPSLEAQSRELQDAGAPRFVTQLGHTDDIAVAAFSPDSRILVTGGELGIAHLWDVSTGLELRSFVAHAGPIRAVAFSRDGARVLTGSEDGSTRIWETATGSELIQLTGHESGVRSVATSSDGIFVLTAGGETVHLSDAATGVLITTITVSSSSEYYGISHVSFVPLEGTDTGLLIGGSDGTVRLWRVPLGSSGGDRGPPLAPRVRSPGVELRVYQSGRADLLTNEVTWAGLSSDGTRVVAMFGGEGVRRWDLATAEILSQIGDPIGRVDAVAYSPDGMMIATAGTKGLILLLDASSKEEIGRFSASVGFYSLAFSPDGLRLAAGDIDGRTRVWDVLTGERVLDLQGHSEAVVDVAYRADGRRIATASSDSTLAIRDAESGALLHRIRTGAGVRSVDFARDPRNVVVATGATVGVLDMESANWVRTFPSHVPRFSGSLATASADGLLVAGTPGDSTVYVWDALTGRTLHHLNAGDGEDLQSLAISSDNRILVAAGNSGTYLWDLETGIGLGTLPVDAFGQSVAISPDGARILVGDVLGSVREFDARTGQDVGQVSFGSFAPKAISHDRRSVYTGGVTSVLRRWDVSTGALLQEYDTGLPDPDMVVSAPGGRFVLLGRGEVAVLYDAETGSRLSTFEGLASEVRDMVASPDGRNVVAGVGSGEVVFWDLTAGRETRRFLADSLGVAAVALSSDGAYLATGGAEQPGSWPPKGGVTRIWSLETLDEVLSLRGHEGTVTSVVLSSDLRRAVTGSTDQRFRLWDLTMTAADAAIDEFGEEYAMTIETGEVFSFRRFPVAVSPRGDVFFTGGYRPVKLRAMESGAELVQLVGHEDFVTSASFTPDGRYLITGSEDETARLWDPTTGAELSRYVGHTGSVIAVAVSSSGRYLATGSTDGSTRVWEVGSQAELVRLPTGATSSLAFTRDDVILVTGGLDGTVRIWNWDLAAKPELARLASLPDGHWLVATPDGRFDADDLEDIEGLQWVMPDDPLRALPIEIFMRDYYEPRLLPRVLAGEELPEVRELASLNRAQPALVITQMSADPGDSTVTVTVEVGSRTRTYGSSSGRAPERSGMHDVHLFRDGQLVGLAEGELLPTLNDSTTLVTFEGIKLPRREGVGQVEFSAYAFNVDRVKSETVRDTLQLPSTLPPRKGRAYVITLGVNAYSDPNWNLSYAANDAWLMGEVLEERLAGTGQYEEVVWVPLVSDHEGERSTSARKSTLQAVLGVLAGEAVAPGALDGVPNASRLREANPEDLVLLSLSSHGYTDRQGTFYIFPEDIGSSEGRRGKELTDELLSRAISSEELTEWFLGVDAGDLVLIVDACHAASAVEGDGGFKPGPMGSRGLGQLAYNKGMRVLAASQAESFAFEVDELQQGLLTYALVKDGLGRHRADHAPQDKQITLTEWLQYGVARVPTLYEEVLSGAIEGRAEVIGGGSEDPLFQQPSLFDFTKRDATVSLGAY